MVVLEDAGGHATCIAERVGAALEGEGFLRRERRPWLPHVTVVRFRARPHFGPPEPALATTGPSDLALYNSVLRRSGAQYEVLESLALGR